jgi:hypothetical protein
MMAERPGKATRNSLLRNCIMVPLSVGGSRIIPWMILRTRRLSRRKRSASTAPMWRLLLLN